jgi:hypothetical protein
MTQPPTALLRIHSRLAASSPGLAAMLAPQARS